MWGGGMLRLCDGGGKHQGAVERRGAYVPSREPVPREVCKRALQVPPARQASLADAQYGLQRCRTSALRARACPLPGGVC